MAAANTQTYKAKQEKNERKNLPCNYKRKKRKTVKKHN